MIHLDYDLAKEACKKYAKETVSLKFPTPGAIIESAKKLRFMNELTDVDAYGLLQQAIAKYGQNRGKEAIDSMPAMLAKTVEKMGWRAICLSTNVDELRNWFFRSYCTLRNREHEMADMSEDTRNLLKKFEFKLLETKK